MDWGAQTASMVSPKRSAQVEDSALTTSTIGEDLIITGNVRSQGDICLDGQIRGDIQCHSLIVSERSQIEGNVVAAEGVVIRGRLIGSVQALRVVLQSKCYVEGDLFAQVLTIEQGAYFDGKSCRFQDPASSSEAENPSRATVKPQTSGRALWTSNAAQELLLGRST